MADEQQTESTELTSRQQLQQMRLERVRKPLEGSRVRVAPRDDVMRAILKHPRGGGFRDVGDIEWPNDRFTQRRIQDGSVTISKPTESQSNGTPQQQSAAQVSGSDV